MDFSIFDQPLDMDSDSNESLNEGEETSQVGPSEIIDVDIESKEEAELPYIPLLGSSPKSPKFENSDMPYINTRKENKNPDKNVDPSSVKNLFDKINSISAATENDGNIEGGNTKNQSLSIVVENLRKVIANLQEVEMWLPEAKESLAPKLKKIAHPIVAALTAYTKEIEKFK